MSNKLSEEGLIELVSTIGFFVCVVVLCIKGQGIEEYIMPMLFTYLLPSPIHSLIKQPTVTKGSGTTQAQSTAQVNQAEQGAAEANKDDEENKPADGITEVCEGFTDTLKV
jgi:hypothetical protein